MEQSQKNCADIRAELAEAKGRHRAYAHGIRLAIGDANREKRKTGEPMNSDQMEIERLRAENERLKARVAALPSARVDHGRIVFCGGLWDEWDISFCVHGEKLRWQCDECEQALAVGKEGE